MLGQTPLLAEAFVGLISRRQTLPGRRVSQNDHCRAGSDATAVEPVLTRGDGASVPPSQYRPTSSGCPLWRYLAGRSADRRRGRCCWASAARRWRRTAAAKIRRPIPRPAAPTTTRWVSAQVSLRSVPPAWGVGAYRLPPASALAAGGTAVQAGHRSQLARRRRTAAAGTTHRAARTRRYSRPCGGRQVMRKHPRSMYSACSAGSCRTCCNCAPSRRGVAGRRLDGVASSSTTVGR